MGYWVKPALMPELTEQVGKADGRTGGDADESDEDTRPLSVRVRGWCAWVCWRVGAIGAAWVVLATTGVAPGVTAATEGVAWGAIVVTLLLGQVWIWLYVTRRPAESSG